MFLNDYTYMIGDHFISALVYGDYTGLNDEEERDLNNWLDSIPVGHWEVTDNTDEFAQCEISMLHGSCVEVKHWVREEDQDHDYTSTTRYQSSKEQEEVGTIYD